MLECKLLGSDSDEFMLIIALESLGKDKGRLKMLELGLIQADETVALNTDKPEEGIKWAKLKGFTNIHIVTETYSRSGRLVNGNVAIVGVNKERTLGSC